MKQYQIYFGKKFYERKDGYWVCTTEAALHAHRWVWMCHNGHITDGYHIHHIDENPGNNDISNLQLLSASDHSKLHSSKIEHKEQARQACIKIAPILQAWNKTEKAKQLRKEWGAKIIENTQPIIITCRLCQAKVETKTYHQKFCSKKCHWKWKYLKYVIEKECAYCKTKFLSRKAKKARFCSPSCAATVQWEMGKFRKRHNQNQLLLTL